MDLYILRHGQAAERDTNLYPNDCDRPLTKRGKSVTKKVAEILKRLDLTFDIILTSPFLRALETAEIAAKVLHNKKKLKMTPFLAADQNPKKIIMEIRKNYVHHEKILLVGHEPYLSTLISVLISGRSDIPILLKKSGLGKLSITHISYSQCATLEWLMPPLN